MHLAGYLAAALIGLSLGLIGGGGSILTVPVLVYLFSISPLLATSYSLFVVGSTSLVGAINNLRKGLVHWKTALLFSISSMLTVYLTRKFLMPLIPEHLFMLGGFEMTASRLTMILFALLMGIAGFSMIRKDPVGYISESSVIKSRFLKLAIYGILIGLVTGLLGAGGGFLLIPVLVLLVRLPMKDAVGTSLLIIALNSMVGFLGDLGQFQTDWNFLLKITAIAMAGILAGVALSRKIPGRELKKGFGWFVILMGTGILIGEFFFR